MARPTFAASAVSTVLATIAICAACAMPVSARRKDSTVLRIMALLLLAGTLRRSGGGGGAGPVGRATMVSSRVRLRRLGVRVTIVP